MVLVPLVAHHPNSTSKISFLVYTDSKLDNFA